MITPTQTSKTSRSNLGVVVLCVGVISAMAGLSYASVPLYRIFCQVTGYGGTTQRTELTDDIPVLDREVTVRFDGNLANKLDWEFKPAQRQVTLKLGEQTEIYYVARNTSDRPVTAAASFNVTPQFAGVYFNKIECFCFTQTTLQPGEEIKMPVIFYVDPELDDEKIFKNLKTITLSYTMFPDEPEDTPVAAAVLKDSIKVIN